MELKKGDKLIFPIAEVQGSLGAINPVVRFEGFSNTNVFLEKEIESHCIKVLGLVGDEGLEAEVGMEVSDEKWTLGRVINVSQEEDEPFPVKVDFFDADTEWFTADGTVEGATKRTLYVTKKKPEKLGWAVIRNLWNRPMVAEGKITAGDAEMKYQERLIHWIPE
jgi:hypothetical protein